MQTSNTPSQSTNVKQRSSTNDISLSVAIDKQTNEPRTVIKKRLPILFNICKSKKTNAKQQGLKSFGFKQKITINKKLKQIRYNNSIQTPFNNQKKLKENRHKRDRLTKLDPNNNRLFYININGINTGNGDHSLLQLCQNLQEVGVDVISLTETNVHWQRPHITSNFKRILQET